VITSISTASGVAYEKTIVVMLCLVCAGAVFAFQPRTGHWWNPAESGRGFNVDVQDGVLVLCVYGYDDAGNATWYLASGPMTNSQHNFTGTLDKYRNGQCLSCNYAGSPTWVGNDGTVTVVFTTQTSATITLPGGHATAVRSFNFGFGEPPQGLLGEWVLIHDETSTVAVKYNLTTLLSATSGGNGVVGGRGVMGDPSAITVCELQTSGMYSGQVICADGDAAGNLRNVYHFRFGLDEMFEGGWATPASVTERPAKGFRSKSWKGYSRMSSAAPSITAMSNDARNQEPLPGVAIFPDSAMLERAKAIIEMVGRTPDGMR
jgi:hypothetical protein